ncbi:hypothetical protein PENVUL_c006G04981 [Penicillium vulpinum]|uniref:Azaphilone pigments biosynthesis cluster protein L N-terminal domain-containing protein n=3 Tax=Penicillium vulpinum TaxID=29845 RepID=A0A1V6S6Q4_9EURO|nr:hypothetical protein PENVUL_c006G04981 [Penicillium vulpinum]
MDPFSLTLGALGITEFALSRISNLRRLINSLSEANDVMQDVTSNLEAIERPLAALENLQISDSTTYAETREVLEKTGVAEAVNICGQACAGFTKKLEQWTKHSSSTKLSLRDRLSVGLWNKEKIQTFRTQVATCQAIVQFAIDSAQLIIIVRCENASKTAREETEKQLRALETSIQEHIELTKRKQDEALQHKEELENPEYESEDEDHDAQRALAIPEIEEQSRVLEADQTASRAVYQLLSKLIMASTSFRDLNHHVQIGVQIGPIDSLRPERPETSASPLSTVPFAQDPDFVSRDTLLDRIQEESSVPGSRIALVGLGGVGKTQLAIAYSYQVRSQSPQTWVFWIHASNEARFKESLRDIADQVKIPGRQDPKVNLFELVESWLRDEKIGKWVCILDNLDDDQLLSSSSSSAADKGDSTKNPTNAPKKPLLEYIPRSRNGFVIITSRPREIALRMVNHNGLVEVKPMERSEAQELLQRKLEKPSHSQESQHLVEALDFMPLAIVQAASYIRNRAPRYSVS